MKKVITIGRQFGCGGREIAKALSEKLNIPFFDRELIEYAANHSGVSSEILEQYDEKATNSLLFSLSLNSYVLPNYSSGAVNLPLNDQLYISQSDIIKKFADEGPCIILGRCSDYILKDREDVLKVFLFSDDEIRRENISRRLGVSIDKAKDIIKKTDKRRASYYSYYTHQKWGEMTNFDLSLNSKIGVEKIVNMIVDCYNK